MSCVIYSPDFGVGFCLVYFVMCNEFLMSGWDMNIPTEEILSSTYTEYENL